MRISDWSSDVCSSDLLFDLGPTDREVSLLIPLIIAMSNWLIIKSIFAQADNNPLIFAMLGMMTALIWRARNRADQPIQSGTPSRLARLSLQPARPYTNCIHTPRGKKRSAINPRAANAAIDNRADKQS